VASVPPQFLLVGTKSARGNYALAIASRKGKLHGMTPKEEQAIEYVQKLRNEYCKGSHLVVLIFDLGSGFANSKLECNHHNPKEANEDARKSIADNLEAGGKPVAVLVSPIGAPVPLLKIFPEFEENPDFCNRLNNYANSL
jgi:hypothetical protein